MDTNRACAACKEAKDRWVYVGMGGTGVGGDRGVRGCRGGLIVSLRGRNKVTW
jgi:hypothetical protein